jgi:hypothetical protein
MNATYLLLQLPLRCRRRLLSPQCILVRTPGEQIDRVESEEAEPNQSASAEPETCTLKVKTVIRDVTHVLLMDAVVKTKYNTKCMSFEFKTRIQSKECLIRLRHNVNVSDCFSCSSYPLA